MVTVVNYLFSNIHCYMTWFSVDFKSYIHLNLLDDLVFSNKILAHWEAGLSSTY